MSHEYPKLCRFCHAPVLDPVGDNGEPYHAPCVRPTLEAPARGQGAPRSSGSDTPLREPARRQAT
jgi:hypothetical protein